MITQYWGSPVVSGRTRSYSLILLFILNIWCDNIKKNLCVFLWKCVGVSSFLSFFLLALAAALNILSILPHTHTRVMFVRLWERPLIFADEAFCDKHLISHHHPTPENPFKESWGQSFTFILRATSALRCVCTAQWCVRASICVSGHTSLCEDTLGEWSSWCLSSDQRTQL